MAASTYQSVDWTDPKWSLPNVHISSSYLDAEQGNGDS